MFVIKSTRARSVLRYVIPFAVIPAVVFLGGSILREKWHLWLSFAVAILSVLLFATGFERKQTGSRRLVLVSVMAALCVAGRFIPFFKPITALTVITAMYMGGEAGFLTGSMAALISNFYFGQGPWTPFQMLAWGLIGLASGLLHKPLKKSRILLCVYGVLTGVLYSLVMDVWTVLWYQNGFRWDLYFSAVVAALPHTALYGVSNFIFLWFFSRPFGQKLECIRIKYGV